MGLLLSIFSLCLVFNSFSKEIAFSFDDAPRGGTYYYSGEQRTKRLISELEKSGVYQAAFFCNSSKLAWGGAERVEAYAEAGHIIANHSHSHKNLNKTDVNNYTEDFLRADKLLSFFENFQKWFRFPFLKEGDTVEKRDAFRKILSKNSYLNAYVTVDNYDFYMDKLLQDAISSSKDIHYPSLREVYLEVMVNAVEFYDDIAVRALGRSPKHVLLMHENDLAALYVSDLAYALRKKGWKTISPIEAYKDEIAEIEPNTLFNGQGRVAAIAHTKGFEKKDLVYVAEDTGYLEKLFNERVFVKKDN